MGSEYTLPNIVVPCPLSSDCYRHGCMKQVRQIKHESKSAWKFWDNFSLIWKRDPSRDGWPFVIASECGCDVWNCSGHVEASKWTSLNGSFGTEWKHWTSQPWACPNSWSLVLWDNQFLLCFNYFELGVLLHKTLATILPVSHTEYIEAALHADENILSDSFLFQLLPHPVVGCLSQRLFSQLWQSGCIPWALQFSWMPLYNLNNCTWWLWCELLWP